jgi:tetratricopeptide (TPR) repeat protein
VLLASIAALSIAAPLHHPLGAQQDRHVTEVSNRSNASMAMLPMATTSADARMHVTVGQHALDMGHVAKAEQHFTEAIAADSTSVLARLGYAAAAPSFGEFAARVEAARRFAPNASRAEQLLLGIQQKELVSDYAGAETLARDLIATAPKNPRTYLELASAQQQAGKESEARKSMERALAVAPNFAPAHLQLAYSYMTAAPTNPAKAGPHVAKLVALEPTEPRAFITQGSYYRATNQLARARASYTRANRLAPDEALPIQQRGHVESFLGNYDAARADYDAAIKLGKQNEAPTYRVMRALVAAHAGNPKQSIDELAQLVNDIDGMGVADANGAKVNALANEALIAMHIGDFETASRALAQRAPLVRAQVATATDEKVKRLVESDNVYWDGLLAARKGDAATARAKADSFMTITAGTTDPQKDQPAHAILGVLALQQKDYTIAAAELAQTNPNDIYMQYELAQALDGAGKSAAAKAIYRKIARYNFNSVGVALVRADATKRAM